MEILELLLQKMCWRKWAIRFIPKIEEDVEWFVANANIVE